jgi:hypothetical protein
MVVVKTDQDPVHGFAGRPQVLGNGPRELSERHSARHDLVPFELPAVGWTDPPGCSGDLLAQPHCVVERTRIPSSAVELDAASAGRNVNPADE